MPRSFVLKAGALGASAQTLVRDFRKIMLPYTAARLKVRTCVREQARENAPRENAHLVRTHP